MKKRSMKSWKKLVAAILAVAMLATSADVQLLAAPAEETVEETTADGTVTENETAASEKDAASDGTVVDHETAVSGEDTTDGEELDAGNENVTAEEPVITDITEEAEVSQETEEEAVQEEADAEGAAEPESTAALTEEEPQILPEVEEEREESSKTFLMSNGTFMVAQYGMPVHYEDENEEWQEIDYSLEEDAEAAVMTAAEDGASASAYESEEYYTTTEKAGDSDRIKFSKKLKEGKTVSIKDTDYPISWGIRDAQKPTVQITEAENEEPKNWNDKFLFVDTGSQLLRYEDIFEGVDAEYMIQPGGIKENIVLKEKGTEASFEIVYDIGELTPVQTDEQTIQLKDGEELIYQIRAPYMQDANGEMSDAITLSLEQTKNKEITVTMTAEEAWLAAEERAYPVILDPSVLTEQKVESIDSVFVASDSEWKTYNFSEKREMLVGRDSSAYEYCRTLVKFVLPTLNPGDMVVDAELNLCMDLVEKYSSGTPDLQANAHIIEEAWNVNTVTWNNKPDHDTTVLDYNFLKESEAYSWQAFDITEAVKGWYEGTIANNGIMLKSNDEDGSYADNCVKARFWPERHNSVDVQYPLIQITYRNNKGLEDYWTYTALSAGTAGTAYVNDYTGNLVFIHDDVSTTGELLPVTLQHVYNSYMQNQRFTGSHPSAGRGWKLSIQQTVLSSEAYGLTGDMLELECGGKVTPPNDIICIQKEICKCQVIIQNIQKR